MISGKSAGLVVAVGLAAAATGIVVVAAIARWHERQAQDQSLATKLRDIQEVLSDCDTKLEQIERHMEPSAGKTPLPIALSPSPG